MFHDPKMSGPGGTDRSRINKFTLLIKCLYLISQFVNNTWTVYNHYNTDRFLNSILEVEVLRLFVNPFRFTSADFTTVTIHTMSRVIHTFSS